MLEAGQRRSVLAAMGIDVYLLRGGGVSATPDVPAAASAQPRKTETALVVACMQDAGSDPGMMRLRGLLPLALGIDAARICWIEADRGGNLPPPPEAGAYLALGAETPRALGAHLSTKQQMSAVIAAADAPALSLRDGLSRRALWQALKPLARQLRTH
jgi:hypothetical protein